MKINYYKLSPTKNHRSHTNGKRYVIMCIDRIERKHQKMMKRLEKIIK